MSKPNQTHIRTLGEAKRTARGFQVIEFKDHNDTACSLQASSLAINTQPGTSAIWLGVQDTKPMVLHGDAKELGIQTNAASGWVPYPIPKAVSLTTRMHLNREQVAALIGHLTRWLESDSIA